jgi:DnaK suppressor protein
MEKEFVEKMKTSLLDLKQEIIQNLISENSEFRSIVEAMDPKDLVDIAADDIDRKMIENLGVQDIKRLRLIDSALARVETGKYGYCMKCNKKIPHERLEAIPYALMCIECKTSDERRNR